MATQQPAPALPAVLLVWGREGAGEEGGVLVLLLLLIITPARVPGVGKVGLGLGHPAVHPASV